MGFWKKADTFWRDPANLFGGKEKAKAAKKQEKAQKENLELQKGLYSQNQEEIAANMDKARGFYSDYGQRGIDALGAGHGSSLASLESGYGQSKTDLAGGYDRARSDLSAGYGKAREGLQSQADLAHYGEDALTGKGFETSAGYGFRLGQGQTALDRMQAASGGRLSGAALKKAMEYNQGFASNEFGNWSNRAMELGQTGYGAQRGIADYSAQEGQGLAGYGEQQGRDMADLNMNYERTRADMQTGYGQNLADMYGNIGGNLAGSYQNQTSLDLANAGNLSGAYNNYAQVPGMVDQAAGNLKGQQASTAASIFGGMFGGPAGSAAAGQIAQNQGGGQNSWSQSGGQNYRRVGSIG